MDVLFGMGQAGRVQQEATEPMGKRLDHDADAKGKHRQDHERHGHHRRRLVGVVAGFVRDALLAQKVMKYARKV